MSYVSGMIGEGNAAQFFAMVRLGNEMPKYEEIVADPKGTKLSKKPDALLLVCHNLAARCREEDLEPVVDYVQRMPAEFTIPSAAPRSIACRGSSIRLASTSGRGRTRL